MTQPANVEAPQTVDAVETEQSAIGRRGLASLRNLPKWFAGLTKRQRLMAAIFGVAAALLLVLGILAWYLIFRQPITELPGLNITVPPTYSYSIANVAKPLGVAVDTTNERVYATQSDGSRTVKVFDIAGNPLGELKAPDNNMHSPVYVAVSRANGDVFVTDRGSNQVYQYNSNGKFVGTVKPDGTKAWGPLGISVAVDGTLYVGDANADPQRVWHLKPDGSVISVFGLKDKLSFPNGIAVYSDGTLVISDSNNSRVLVYNADGSLRGLLARGTADAPLGMPRGVTIGAGDRLYIADTINDVVRIFKPGSLPEYAVSFGEPGQLDGQMNYPNAVATDDHGHIFVADRENNRVQVWTNR